MNAMLTFGLVSMVAGSCHRAHAQLLGGRLVVPARTAHTRTALAASSRRQAILHLTIAALGASPPLAALAAAELTEEQQVIVEAWAVVQRGFVDQQFNGKDWKAIKSDYLKRKNLGNGILIHQTTTA